MKKIKLTESDKTGLLAALAVCLIGILVAVVIVVGVDIYRKHTYTCAIPAARVPHSST